MCYVGVPDNALLQGLSPNIDRFEPDLMGVLRSSGGQCFATRSSAETSENGHKVTWK